MRALQFTRFGPPDILELVERPIPRPGADEALIAVKAASINPSDVKNLAGAMEGTSLPRIPGRDFSGRVIAGPTTWVGRDVWGASGDLGFAIDGTHADHVVLPVAALAAKPANLTHEETASLGVTFLAAWLGAVVHGGLSHGETVAVIGAGGVGSAVVQIAKSFGCSVYASNREPIAPESAIGRRLDGTIAATAEASKNLRELTNGQGADLVFDTVGGVQFETALACVAPRGRVIEISATGKRRVEFDLIDFYHNETRLIGADTRKLDADASRRILEELTPRFERGDFDPPEIAARYDLTDGIAAYQAVAKGAKGRIVLVP